nr:mucin-2-like [Nothobranchius furzeri]
MVFAESNCVVLSLLCAGGCVWRAAGEQLLPICSSVVRGFKERWDNSSVPDDTQHWETSPPPTKPPSAARKLTGFQPCLPVPSLTPDRLLSNPHLPTRTPPTLVLSSQPHLTLALPAQPAVTCPPLSALPTTRKLTPPEPSDLRPSSPSYIIINLFYLPLSPCMILHVVGQKAAAQHDSDRKAVGCVSIAQTGRHQPTNC